jgi:hypothetical protein
MVAVVPGRSCSGSGTSVAVGVGVRALAAAAAEWQLVSGAVGFLGPLQEWSGSCCAVTQHACCVQSSRHKRDCVGLCCSNGGVSSAIGQVSVLHCMWAALAVCSVGLSRCAWCRARCTCAYCLQYSVGMVRYGVLHVELAVQGPFVGEHMCAVLLRGPVKGP